MLGYQYEIKSTYFINNRKNFKWSTMCHIIEKNKEKTKTKKLWNKYNRTGWQSKIIPLKKNEVWNSHERLNIQKWNRRKKKSFLLLLPSTRGTFFFSFVYLLVSNLCMFHISANIYFRKMFLTREKWKKKENENVENAFFFKEKYRTTAVNRTTQEPLRSGTKLKSKPSRNRDKWKTDKQQINKKKCVFNSSYKTYEPVIFVMGCQFFFSFLVALLLADEKSLPIPFISHNLYFST